MRCPRCGSGVADSRLSCPVCHQLIHAERLKSLAAEAEAAEARGDVAAAGQSWNEAQQLLPPESRQHESVQARIDSLEERRVKDALPGPKTAPKDGAGPGWKKIGVGAGTVGLLLWKAKAIIAFVLTKGKLLLLSLTKTGPLLGVLASFGVYWAAWGWAFAIGVMVSLYLHELGHVAALKRAGIPASAPMFVPGLGAFVRLKRRPPTPQVDAMVGLAGPLWGLAAAAVTWVVFLITGWPVWGGVARFAAWINLFNLVPVWQLDGSRGFAALSRLQRFLAVLLVAAVYWQTREGLLILVGLLGLYRVVVFDGPEQDDWNTLLTYCGLVVLLTLLSGITVPV